MGAGSRLTAAAYRRDAMAQIDAQTAPKVEHWVAVATNTVAWFDDFNQAQEAFALMAPIEGEELRGKVFQQCA